MVIKPNSFALTGEKGTQGQLGTYAVCIGFLMTQNQKTLALTEEHEQILGNPSLRHR